MDAIGLGLKQALESGDCVLFVGAGIGEHVRDEQGKPAPDGGTLAGELAAHFGIEISDIPDLAKISQLVEIRKKGRTELEAFIKRRLSGLEPDEPFQWLTTLRWKAIFTTNYDNSLQRAYSKNPNPPQTPVTIAATSDLVPFERKFQVPIYHLHGTLFDVEKPRIIITEDDYAAFKDRRRMFFSILKQEFATSTFLYIGYSNRDPNWKLMFEELRAEFLPAQTPQSYRISPHTNPLDEEIFRSKGIETINASYDDFQKAASVALAGSRVSPDVLKRLESSIQSDLLGAFDKHPASVARLLAGWEYVNQAAFNAAPNARDFLLGNRANWALVAKRIHFERDLEPQIYEDLLDYATSSSKKPLIILVLGPAGYGRTTLLMSIAAKLVGDKAGSVFFQKAGTPLLEVIWNLQRRSLKVLAHFSSSIMPLIMSLHCTMA
jgi:hypothetical protein